MLILLGMASCYQFETEEEENQPIYDRTVLVYMAAENSLSEFSQEDIEEMMQAIGSIPSNSRLIIYLDDTNLPRILTIEEDKGSMVSRLLYEYPEDLNSSDAATLRQVAEWTADHYPSSSYGLVMWSHGDAWIPTKSPIQRSICIDNERNSHSNKGSKMNINDMADALKDFNRFEFILFDACFMQAVEVAYTLRKITRYIVASPAEVPGPGAPYNTLLAPMFSSPLNIKLLVDTYYQEYSEDNTYGVCLSAVDCNHLETLASATTDMIVKYASMEHEISLDSIQCYYTAKSNLYPEYYDMNGYMSRLITNDYDYVYWRSIFDQAVFHKQTTDRWYSVYTDKREHVDIKNYGGISCYVPQKASTHNIFNEQYRTTQWYEVSGWKIMGW